MALYCHSLLVLVLALGGIVHPLLPCQASKGEVTWVLDHDHESYKWRAAVGRDVPSPSSGDDDDMKRVILWTRHKSIGIGNALSGYARVMMDALLENRTMVIRSVILRKFCEVVQCRVHELPAGIHPPRDADVRQCKNFQIHLEHPKPDDELAGLSEFYEPAGCGLSLLQPTSRSSRSSSSSTDSSYLLQQRACLFKRLLQALVVSTRGARLQEEQLRWLQQYYHGNSARFASVMMASTPPTPSLTTTSATSIVKKKVFDATIHVRTLELLEGQQLNGHGASEPTELPEAVKQEKAARFVATPAFANMVACFARQVAQIASSKSASASTSSHDRNTISVYVATDSSHVRVPFADKLKRGAEALLNANSQETPWQVEVNYFDATLPPAHFFAWTKPMPHMTGEDWQRLVGTTAEWLFLGQGNRMLTVKGTGGDSSKASASSFATSAAAFGAVPEVTMLRGVEDDGTCEWDQRISFA